MSESQDHRQGVEWMTLALIAGCYGLWTGAIFWLAAVAPVLAVPVTGALITMHASLTHEALHGHPFRSRSLNEALMVLPLNLAIPYNRFRDLHLAHHRDADLTDPYDDPETNFIDPVVWSTMPAWKRAVYSWNNTLLGRIVVGAAIGQAVFFRDEWRGARRGDQEIWLAWGLHAIGAAAVVLLVMSSAMPLWAYLIAAYIGLSLLKIRTFLEHRAHELARGRTVIVEDRGPLAFLFLNNNLHAVHHMNPGVAWYRLPALYRAGRDRFLACNDGYVFRSYGEVFRRYFWRAKDPVPHPLWPNE